jgi:hypothetical protein
MGRRGLVIDGTMKLINFRNCEDRKMKKQLLPVSYP